MVKQLILSVVGFIAGGHKISRNWKKTKKQQSKERKRVKGNSETEVFGSSGVLW